METYTGQQTMINTEAHKKKSKYIINNLKKYKALYLMALPGILYFIIFKYIPLGGIIIAFQDYSVFKGILKSDFIGFKNFITLFNYGDFSKIFLNTVLINLYDLIFSFPAPIILALMINEVSKTSFKRLVQSTVYLPHFLSWVVLGGIVSTQFLSLESGLINYMISYFGGDPIYFLAQEKYARAIVVGSGIWKETGWGTVIYLAALAGVNQNLYEAASIDGAGRMRQLFAITIPTILPVIVVMFLLKIGHFLDYGFDRVWVFLNGANRSKIEIFDTYVYQTGLAQGRFSYATAVGLFKSVFGLAALTMCNKLSKKFTGQSLF